MIFELLMIIGAVSGVLILGNAIFGRMIDKRLEGYKTVNIIEQIDEKIQEEYRNGGSC